MFGKYLKYRLTAHYWHGHHIHSPYTYWIMTNVVYERWPYYSFEKIEGLRKKTPNNEKGKLEAKYCQLIQRLCATNNAKTIVQIGCDDGWETMYLAANDLKTTISVEGKIERRPRERMQLLGYCNILEEYDTKENVDMLVCIDGKIKNSFERYVNNMREGGIMIFSKIHEREDEWNEIIKDSRIKVSMDLYKVGICFFRGEMQKENYVVKF